MHRVESVGVWERPGSLNDLERGHLSPCQRGRRQGVRSSTALRYMIRFLRAARVAQGSRTWCHSCAPSMASWASSSRSREPPDSDSVRELRLCSPLARRDISSSPSSLPARSAQAIASQAVLVKLSGRR